MAEPLKISYTRETLEALAESWIRNKYGHGCRALTASGCAAAAVQTPEEYYAKLGMMLEFVKDISPQDPEDAENMKKWCGSFVLKNFPK